MIPCTPGPDRKGTRSSTAAWRAFDRPDGGVGERAKFPQEGKNEESEGHLGFRAIEVRGETANL